MAKDNIPFHTVIFPASLLGSGRDWTMLHHINSTEYLNYEDTKFSKSRNVGVFGTDVKETGIPTDLWRFYLLFIRPEKNDSAFNWEEFFERINSDFLDNIGNLVNRTLVFLFKNFEGEIKDADLPQEHQDFIAACQADCNAITQSLEDVKLRDSLRLILALGNRGNKFFQDMEPWAKIKTEPNHAHATVSTLTYLIRSLAVALEPYMPETAARMFSFLNLPAQSWDVVGQFKGLDGHRARKPEILFRKLDLKLAEKFRKKFSGEQPDPGKFHIKAVKITAVESHPNSDRLYVLNVDAGEGQPRTVVAGLVKHYAAQDLENRKVLLLANLAEAEIRGVASQGMILVCEKRNKTELLDGAPFEVGDELDVELTPGEISIDAFKKAPFSVQDHQVLFDDEPLLLAGQPIKTQRLQNGKVR